MNNKKETPLVGLEDLMKVDTLGKTKIKAKLEALHRLLVDYHYHGMVCSKDEENLVPFNDGTKIRVLLKSIKDNRLSLKRLDEEDLSHLLEIKTIIALLKEEKQGWYRIISCLNKMETLQGLPLLEQWNRLTTYEKTNLKILQEHVPFQLENREYLRLLLVEWFTNMRNEKYLNYMREYLTYVKTTHMCPQYYNTSTQQIAYFSDGVMMNSFRREIQNGDLEYYFNGENKELVAMVVAYSKVLSNRRMINLSKELKIWLSSIQKYQEKSLFYQDKELLEALAKEKNTTQKRLMVLELLDKASNTYINKTDDYDIHHILVKRKG